MFHYSCIFYYLTQLNNEISLKFAVGAFGINQQQKMLYRFQKRAAAKRQKQLHKT